MTVRELPTFFERELFLSNCLMSTIVNLALRIRYVMSIQMRYLFYHTNYEEIIVAYSSFGFSGLSF